MQHRPTLDATVKDQRFCLGTMLGQGFGGRPQVFAGLGVTGCGTFRSLHRAIEG